MITVEVHALFLGADDSPADADALRTRVSLPLFARGELLPAFPTRRVKTVTLGTAFSWGNL